MTDLNSQTVKSTDGSAPAGDTATDEKEDIGPHKPPGVVSDPATGENDTIEGVEVNEVNHQVELDSDEES